MYCYYKCSVALSHGVMGGSAVYDCVFFLIIPLTGYLLFNGSSVFVFVLVCITLCPF